MSCEEASPEGKYNVKRMTCVSHQSLFQGREALRGLHIEPAW